MSKDKIKKIIVVILVIVFIILLLPVRVRLTDGTIVYRSVIYRYKKINSDLVKGKVIEIFGVEFYNSLQNISTKKVKEITLGKRNWIDSLKEYKIKGTEDTFEVTKAVKWKVPEHEKGTTVSFTILVPYVITVDGKEYSGEYYINNATSSVDDGNPKYIITFNNLNEYGDIEVSIEEMTVLSEENAYDVTILEDNNSAWDYEVTTSNVVEVKKDNSDSSKCNEGEACEYNVVFKIIPIDEGTTVVKFNKRDKGSNEIIDGYTYRITVGPDLKISETHDQFTEW